MRNAFVISGIYLGSVIGAGFSSGQELLRFFVVFGSDGLWGIIVASAMFALLGGIILERVFFWRTASHHELLHRLCGDYIGSVIDIVLSIFVFAALAVMLAATGTLLRELYGVPNTFGIVGMALITREIVKRGVQRLLAFNGVFVTALLAITVVVLLPLVLQDPFPTQVLPPALSAGMVPRNWFVGSALYVSFNLALALSPLGALGAQLESRKTALLGAALGGLGLGLAGMLIVVVLLSHLPGVATEDLPILSILNNRLAIAAPIYALALILAILTSCVSAAYGLGERLRAYARRADQTPSWIPLLAVPIAYIGFGTLVQTLYPILGYVGVAVVAMGAWRSWMGHSAPPSK